MTCPHCAAADRLFDDRVARKDLRRYRTKGPIKSTRRLLDLIGHEGVKGKSLLDVGGGIGALQHELVARGVARTTDVDASKAYLETARGEARRLGYLARADYLHGDLVDLASGLDVADLVTLDRVVCCYPDASLLLQRATALATDRIGLVWPKDTWWTRAVAGAMNLGFRIMHNPFRMRVHPDRLVRSALERSGFRESGRTSAGFWQVAVWARRPMR